MDIGIQNILTGILLIMLDILFLIFLRKIVFGNNKNPEWNKEKEQRKLKLIILSVFLTITGLSLIFTGISQL